MKFFEKSYRFERFNMNWQRLLIQGLAIFVAGLVLALASTLNPAAVIMSARYFSWLPLCGMVIFALGLLECLDAYLAKEQRDFFQNLQVGVLDSVVGGLIILSVTESPARLSLMIAAFLIARGIVRIALTCALRLPQRISTVVSGFVSIVTGFMVFFEWPVPDGWFIAFCLSIEIAFRGWAMMMFSLWVRKNQNNAVN